MSSRTLRALISQVRASISLFAHLTSFPGAYYPHLPLPQPILMRKRMTWYDLYAYFRTASALHTFLERNPEDGTRPEGDIGMRFWRSLVSFAQGQVATVMTQDTPDNQQGNISDTMFALPTQHAAGPEAV